MRVSVYIFYVGWLQYWSTFCRASECFSLLSVYVFIKSLSCLSSAHCLGESCTLIG